MAQNLTRQPKRGILKTSSSFERKEASRLTSHSKDQEPKNPHFDESNIAATLHPPDKDYGFMKIEEPKTPYEYASGADEEDDDEGPRVQAASLDPVALAARIAMDATTSSSTESREDRASSQRSRRVSEPSGDEEDLKLLSPEEREKRRNFEQKRKAHYNEFHAVKMARQLINNDDESEGDGDGSNCESESSDKVKRLEVDNCTSALSLADSSTPSDSIGMETAQTSED